MRARFTEYAARFVRIAARYEEEVLGMITSIGWPTVSYTEHYGDRPQLGSGICFSDEGTGARELAVNASRIEAWRRTESYQLYQHVCFLSLTIICVAHFLPKDFMRLKSQSPIQGIDVAHQLWKLRHARYMTDGEVELIMRTLAENIHSYDQVTEVRQRSPNLIGPLLISIYSYSLSCLRIIKDCSP